MFVMSIFLLGAMYFTTGIYFILAALFFYVFPIGVLFSTSTELAITPFSENSGSASALFGSIQLGVSFLCTILFGVVNNDTILIVGLAFFSCSLLGVIMSALIPKKAVQPARL